MAPDCFTANSSFRRRANSLPESHIQLCNPYSSGLIFSFLGRIPEAARTLDLPLLHVSRPHFMPPCLLLPTHTFLLPLKAPQHTLSTISSPTLPHVLDCSFMPSHPHCLVSSCTGGVGSGSVYTLDLHTCRVIQAFTLPSGPSIACRPFSVPAGPGSSFNGRSPVTYTTPSACHLPAAKPSFGWCAPSRVSCASIHRDPSCPLVFLGTSEGDVLAYDLRFAGGSFHSCPCLSLRGAHDGLVSGVRAASGPLLPAHLFFTSGLVDGWIRLFDLRFPHHYSACNGVGVTAGDGSRGSVPYPVEAVQPNPSFSVRERGCSHEQAARVGGTAKSLDAAEDAREAMSAASLVHPGNCLCCPTSRSSGGIAGIDLSPDGALLAVAHVRTVSLDFNGAGGGYTLQVKARQKLPQAAATACWLRSTRQPMLSKLDGEPFLAGEREDSSKPAAELLENENTGRGHCRLAEESRSPNRPERTPSRLPCGAWRAARRDSGRLEGETIIFSVSEGLQVLKTLAVADACAFTGVEFSANGKYLLQTGGISNGAACMVCQSCACCCCCSDFSSSYACHKEDAHNLVDHLSTGHTQVETRKIHAQHRTRAAPPADSSRSVAKRGRNDWRGTEGEGSERELSTRESVITRHPRSRTDSAQVSHRAQIVNLLQCNRVVLLKSPADGALAFADTSLVNHRFACESNRKPCAHGVHAYPITVAGRWILPGSQVLHSRLNEFSSVSADVGDADDCFTLKLHVSSSLTRDTRVKAYEISGADGNSTDMDHSSLPLDLRLYSPSSQLMERRRQAFWQTETGLHTSLRSGQIKRSSARRCAEEEVENLEEGSRRKHRERTPRSKGRIPANACSSAVQEFLSGMPGSAISCARRHRSLLKQTEDQALIRRKGQQLPLPRCNSQNSLFLTACGVLHPQWGRYDCFSQRFQCTFWGGLIAGIGGSRIYPGLKLWHPATGVVLTCAEGPLASQQAVRCVRGHPDLSLGILATGGALRVYSAAAASVASSRCSEHNNRMQCAGASSTRVSGWCKGGCDASSTVRLPKVTCAAVTLWSLEHRDTVLERALQDSYECALDKGSLRVDPSDEERECSSPSKQDL